MAPARLSLNALAPEGRVTPVLRPENQNDSCCQVEDDVFYWATEFRDDE